MSTNWYQHTAVTYSICYIQYTKCATPREKCEKDFHQAQLTEISTRYFNMETCKQLYTIFI